MKTEIKQTQSYFNPYIFRGKQVQHIYFFDADGIKISTKWFGSGSNNEYPMFIIPSEVKGKRKVDFNMKKAFHMPNKERHFEGINLYIPLSLFEHELETKVLDRENNLEKVYCDVLTIKIESIKKQCRLDEYQELEYYNSDLQLHEIKVRSNLVFEPKPLKIKNQKIAEDFNRLTNKNISHYDIGHFLTEYKITKI